MRKAHDVATVRAAEHALMATVPPGALMQRAAAGLAAVCAGLAGKVYGARIVVLAGSGDNGGDALYAGARLARRGARVTAVAAGGRVHEGGTADLRAAGGRVTGPDAPDLPAVIVAGSDRFTGAAVLAVGGALRGGAGMVRLVSAGPAVAVVRQHWPEALTLATGDGSPAGREIETVGRVQAWVAGPGMGTDGAA